MKYKEWKFPKLVVLVNQDEGNTIELQNARYFSHILDGKLVFTHTVGDAELYMSRAEAMASEAYQSTRCLLLEV